MIKEKKGFTLIELLGTIALISVVFLIAVPIVMDYTTNARRQSLITSTSNLIKQAQMECGLEKECFFVVEDGMIYESDKTYGKGEYVSSTGGGDENGILHVSVDGLAEGAIYNDKWCTYRKINEKEITIKDYIPNNCNLS